MPNIATENKEVNSIDFVEFLEKRVLQDDALNGSKAYKAVCSFLSFLGGDNESLMTDLESILLDWMITLCFRGLSYATAFSYLKAISGLYTRTVKEGLASPIEAFSTVKTRIKEVENVWNNGLTAQEFKSFQTFAKAVSHKEAGVSVEADLILMSLLYGTKPIMEVANLKGKDIESNDATLRLIAKRQLGDSTRQYIFPLTQGKTTPEKFFRDINERLMSFFDDNALRWFDDADETVRTYWAYGAVLVGVRPHVLMSVLNKTPKGLSVLKCLEGRRSNQMLQPKIATEVSKMFTTNPKRWFAMHLRTRITFEELEKKLDGLKDEVDVPELFYPCKEIARQVGKRKIFETQPIIRDIVYFKARVTSIQSLFYKIGDIAWCYKNDGIKGSSYAVIPESSFKQFQETIGCFTPEFAEYFDSLEPLKKDDDIKVIGGLLSGYSGKLKKVITDTPDGVIRYFVEVWKDSESLKIKGNVDGRQVRKLTAADKVEAL